MQIRLHFAQSLEMQPRIYTTIRPLTGELSVLTRKRKWQWIGRTLGKNEHFIIVMPPNGNYYSRMAHEWVAEELHGAQQWSKSASLSKNYGKESFPSIVRHCISILEALGMLNLVWRRRGYYAI